MRDPERISMIATDLEKLWKLMPDIRLGQLIDNLNSKYNNGQDFFYIEDNKWHEWILKELEIQTNPQTRTYKSIMKNSGLDKQTIREIINTVKEFKPND